MKKILLILSREYRLRLRRPSFWVLTLLVPLLLAALYALPVMAANRNARQAEVLVVDETGLFEHSLRSSDELSFRRMPSLDYAHDHMADDSRIAAILYIPARETTIPRDAFLYHRSSEPPLALQQSIAAQLQMLLRNAILEDVYGLDPEVYRSVANTDIKLHTRDAATGHESFARVKGVLAAVLAVLMVLALVVFGVQVMRSVQEEKSTRVAEVVAASVHPVQLMVGKISGVALTAITQLVLWVLLTLSPLLVTLMLIPLLVPDPDGTLAQWLTLVPFSAPAAVVLRLPFGISTVQLILSALLLLLAFLAAALLAARTYRRHLVR